MTALETRTSHVSPVLRWKEMAVVASPALAWRRCLGVSVAFYALGLLVVALPSFAQTAPPASPRTAIQVTESSRQIDAGTASCSELKARVRDSDSGTLVIGSGSTGGGSFHARAPQCDFWQSSQFAYVMAEDGWCGVGYTCAARIQGGR